MVYVTLLQFFSFIFFAVLFCWFLQIFCCIFKPFLMLFLITFCCLFEIFVVLDIAIFLPLFDHTTFCHLFASYFQLQTNKKKNSTLEKSFQVTRVKKKLPQTVETSKKKQTKKIKTRHKITKKPQKCNKSVIKINKKMEEMFKGATKSDKK